MEQSKEGERRRPWRRSREVEEDVDDELGFHLEMRTRDFERAGLTTRDPLAFVLAPLALLAFALAAALLPALRATRVNPVQAIRSE